MTASAPPTPVFTVPASREAKRPPERRGVPRDGVRLLTVTPGWVRHSRFGALPHLLDSGDLVVVNTSPTLPAALAGRLVRAAGREGDRTVRVHVSSPLDDGTWAVEVRRADNTGPEPSAAPGDEVVVDPGAHGRGPRLRLLAPYPVATAGPVRLWRTAVSGPALGEHLHRHGRPIRYGYLDAGYPLSDYQNAYARTVAVPVDGPDPMPGSAEMASAGRPLTAAVLAGLLARGVVVTDLTLHAGVSSPEVHEPPAPERFAVPAHTADLVTAARARGRRVVAVGTTVVRALETAATPWGEVRAGSGWTDLVLDGGRRTRVVDGLLTGLHEARASHLRLLTAVAGPDLVRRAYRAVTSPEAPEDYLWHEFGDSMLLLP